MTLFLDIHALQTLPASNVNRDDSGAPKNTTFGGVLRGRVSSQSWKKAIRDYFKSGENLADSSGVRTRWLIKEIATEIQSKDADKSLEDAKELAKNALSKIGIKTNSKKGREEELDVILFLSKKQIEKIAELTLENIEDKEFKKRLKEIANNENAYDMALFGRMVAADPGFNIEAASQFAHAFGIDALTPEFDFWSATDDIGSEDHAGAGNLGVFEFNSSTYYRFASINFETLQENLGRTDSMNKAVEEFLLGFFHSVPQGKANSFSAHTRPTALVLTLRENAPVSYANAFESPVIRERTKTVAEVGFEKMNTYANSVKENFGIGDKKTWVITILEHEGKVTFKEAIADIQHEISAHYPTENNENTEGTAQ